MPPKRIILMYISEISGHHSATIAIEKALEALESNTEILNLNAFNYTNPISEKIINRIYLSVIKSTPQIWDYLYDNPNVAKKLERIKNRIHKLNSPKLKILFDKYRPDAVVCTQAFPCGMVADYKKSHNPGLPLIAVLTDYIPHSYWIYDSVNYYITPSQEVSERLILKGAPSAKVKDFGIPFDHKFNNHSSREGAAGILGLDPKLPTILIMGGGQGLGPIKTIIRSLDKIKTQVQSIVVSGSNKKLYHSLRNKKYKKPVLAFGYVDNINEMMDASNIIVTKPGGITTAEALSKKIPMIIVKPIPGQEANNARYLTEKGAAIRMDKPKDIGALIEHLLRNPSKLRQMRDSAGRISKPDASMDMARLLLNL